MHHHFSILWILIIQWGFAENWHYTSHLTPNIMNFLGPPPPPRPHFQSVFATPHTVHLWMELSQPKIKPGLRQMVNHQFVSVFFTINQVRLRETNLLEMTPPAASAATLYRISVVSSMMCKTCKKQTMKHNLRTLSLHTTSRNINWFIRHDSWCTRGVTQVSLTSQTSDCLYWINSSAHWCDHFPYSSLHTKLHSWDMTYVQEKIYPGNKAYFQDLYQELNKMRLHCSSLSCLKLRCCLHTQKD